MKWDVFCVCANSENIKQKFKLLVHFSFTVENNDKKIRVSYFFSQVKHICFIYITMFKVEVFVFI